MHELGFWRNPTESLRGRAADPKVRVSWKGVQGNSTFGLGSRAVLQLVYIKAAKVSVDSKGLMGTLPIFTITATALRVETEALLGGVREETRELTMR